MNLFSDITNFFLVFLHHIHKLQQTRSPQLWRLSEILLIIQVILCLMFPQLEYIHTELIIDEYFLLMFIA